MIPTNIKESKYHQRGTQKLTRLVQDSSSKGNSIQETLRPCAETQEEMIENSLKESRDGNTRWEATTITDLIKRATKESNFSLKLLLDNLAHQERENTLRLRKLWDKLQMISPRRQSKIRKNLLESRRTRLKELWMGLWRTSMEKLVIKELERLSLDQTSCLALTIRWTQDLILEAQELTLRLSAHRNGVFQARQIGHQRKHLARRTRQRHMGSTAKRCSTSARTWVWSKKACTVDLTKLLQLQLRQKRFNSKNKRNQSRSLMSSRVILSKSLTKEREIKIKEELPMLSKKLPQPVRKI